MFEHFLYGLVIGAVMSAPVGPLGALALQNTLAGHWRESLSIGFGSAIADAFLAAIAFSAGASFLARWLKNWEMPLAFLIGCLFLALAIILWRKPVNTTPLNKKASFSIGVTATLFHPGNVTAFTLIFATWGLHQNAMPFAEKGWLIAGIAAGAFSAWSFFVLVAHRLRHHISAPWLQRVLDKFVSGFMALAGFLTAAHSLGLI